MAEGRQRSEWSQTSALMALTARCHGIDKKPSDFDPFAQQNQVSKPPVVSVMVLKGLFKNASRT